MITHAPNVTIKKWIVDVGKEEWNGKKYEKICLLLLIEDIPKHKRKFMKRPFWILIAFMALAACGGSNKRILDLSLIHI